MTYGAFPNRLDETRLSCAIGFRDRNHRIDIIGFVLGLIQLCLLLGCQPTIPTHNPWPEADTLFRHKSLFRGADSAYSADLGNGRVLWLFGDTFIGTKPNSRHNSYMIRNSIAIQHGYNPATATVDFYMREEREQAGSFLPNLEASWYWFGPAVKVGEQLLLTSTEVALNDGGLGFQAIGSAAFMVPNPDDSPLEWILNELRLPPMPNGVRFGTGALLLEGDHLFAFMAVEPGNHDVYLARWHLDDVNSDDLSTPQWYHTERGWDTSFEGIKPIVRAMQTEFSVHRDPESTKLQLISVDGFGATNIVVRTADTPEGPWAKPRFMARPEESDRGEGVYVYSAKAHPHLSGGETIITYSTNRSGLF